MRRGYGGILNACHFQLGTSTVQWTMSLSKHEQQRHAFQTDDCPLPRTNDEQRLKVQGGEKQRPKGTSANSAYKNTMSGSSRRSSAAQHQGPQTCQAMGPKEGVNTGVFPAHGGLAWLCGIAVSPNTFASCYSPQAACLLKYTHALEGVWRLDWQTPTFTGQHCP